MSQNHRLFQHGKDHKGVSHPNPCSKQGQVRPGSSEPHSVRSWKPPRTKRDGETAQPLWATCSNTWLVLWEKKSFSLFHLNHWQFNLCFILFFHVALLWRVWLHPLDKIKVGCCWSPCCPQIISSPSWIGPVPPDSPYTSPASNNHGILCWTHSSLLTPVFYCEDKTGCSFLHLF